MLTPDELKVLPDNIIKLYQDLEDDIISDIARRLEKAGRITDSADWQMYMLGNMGNDLEKIKRRIVETNRISSDRLEALFNEAAVRSMEYENIVYTKALRGSLSLFDSPTMMNFVAANYKKTDGELRNLTKSLGFKVGNSFKSVAKMYQDTLNYAQFQVASGAFSYDVAIRNAVKSLADSGLRTVDYESGRSNMLDVAVRRATLTGINQTVSELCLMQMSELGGEYVEVSAHMGARPDHQIWQGKVYHIGGEKDGYDDFESSTHYGSGDGLCGWNCRHSFSVFFPGISVRNYSDDALKNIDSPPIEYDGKVYSHYEATQRQRVMERSIRKTKRELIAYDSAGLKDEFTAKSIRLRRQRELYNDFSRTMGLKTRSERHSVYGFGRSVSGRSAWSNKKAFSNINLQLFGKNDKSAVLKLLDEHKLPRKRFNKNKSLFDKLFVNGVDTPIEKVYNNRDSFYHIVYGHSSFAYEKNYVKTIRHILLTPDEIYRTTDKFKNTANAYLKYINNDFYLVIVRNGNIITSYSPTVSYINNKVRKGVKIL